MPTIKGLYKFSKKELTIFDKKFKYVTNIFGIWIYGEETNKRFGIMLETNNDGVCTHWNFWDLNSPNSGSYVDRILNNGHVIFIPKTNKEFVDFIENQFKK